jgi:hypothetical protein
MSDDLASSVRSIVAAFASGLEIFKKIRRRRRKKTSNNTTSSISQQELQLGRSLRKGSKDVLDYYERGHQTAGDKFARGDTAANTSLAATLLKLNTGLVNIISSFLRPGRENFTLDCKSLASLSDASRADAIDAMNQLYIRLSQSSLSLPSCTKCHSLKTQGEKRQKPSSKITNKSLSTEKKKQYPRIQARYPERRASPNALRVATIARVPMDGSSQSQLAIVRPRNRRTSSSMSSASSKSGTSDSSVSSAQTTPNDNALMSSTPAKSMSPAPPYTALPDSTLSHRIDVSQRKTIQPPNYYARVQTIHSPSPINESEMWESHLTYLHPRNRASSTAPPDLTSSRPRNKRQSTYSFASDSTKLGEIPLSKWAQPFDFAEMEKLNHQLANTMLQDDSNESLEQTKKSRGIFGFFKKKRS